MGIIVFAIVVLLTFFVYKKTRSTIWALVTFVIAFMVVPLLWDQVKLLWIEDKAMTTTTTTPGSSTTPTVAYNRTSTKCSCSQ